MLKAEGIMSNTDDRICKNKSGNGHQREKDKIENQGKNVGEESAD